MMLLIVFLIPKRNVLSNVRRFYKINLISICRIVNKNILNKIKLLLSFKNFLAIWPLSVPKKDLIRLVLYSKQTSTNTK